MNNDEMIKKCPSCGNQVNDGELFCRNCGTKLVPEQNENNAKDQQITSNPVEDNTQLNESDLSVPVQETQAVNNINKNNTNNHKKNSTILSIVAFVISFAITYLIFSGTLSKLFNKNEADNNTNANVESKTVSLDRLQVSIPSDFVAYDQSSKYAIYTSADQTCFISLITTDSSVHSSPSAMIDASLAGAASNTNGKIGSYTINTKEINSNIWNYTQADIYVESITLNENIYAILSNGKYYALQFQNYNNNSKCGSNKILIENSLKLN